MFRTKLQTAKVGFITWVSATYRRPTLAWQGKGWGEPVPSEEKEPGLWKFGNYCLKALSSCPHPTEAGCLPSVCLTILLTTVFPAPQHHFLSLTCPLSPSHATQRLCDTAFPDSTCIHSDPSFIYLLVNSININGASTLCP